MRFSPRLPVAVAVGMWTNQPEADEAETTEKLKADASPQRARVSPQ